MTKTNKAEEEWDVDKVAEVVNTRNVLAVAQYAEETRVMFRELEEKVRWLENEVRTLLDTNAQLLQQVGILRGEVYGGGATEVE